MAVEPLSEHLKAAGHAVMMDLDRAGITPQGAMWLYFHSVKDWRYTVVSDLIDTVGRRKLYGIISDLLGQVPAIDGLGAFDIHLAASSEIMPQVLGGNFRLENGTVGLSDCNINGMRVDALIYRLTPPRSDRDIKLAARKIESRPIKIHATA